MTHPRVCLTCVWHDKVADCTNSVIHDSIMNPADFTPADAYFNTPVDFHCSLYELDSKNPELDSISSWVRAHLPPC